MPEPFGRRNRRTVSRPAVTKRARHRRPTPSARQARISRRIHFYIVGGILFLVLAGYAFAT